MNAALLSRFDLIFILLDKPDEMLDKRVSDHIMAVSVILFTMCWRTAIDATILCL